MSEIKIKHIPSGRIYLAFYRPADKEYSHKGINIRGEKVIFSHWNQIGYTPINASHLGKFVGIMDTNQKIEANHV